MADRDLSSMWPSCCSRVIGPGGRDDIFLSLFFAPLFFFRFLLFCFVLYCFVGGTEGEWGRTGLNALLQTGAGSFDHVMIQIDYYPAADKGAF